MAATQAAAAAHTIRADNSEPGSSISGYRDHAAKIAGKDRCALPTCEPPTIESRARVSTRATPPHQSKRPPEGQRRRTTGSSALLPSDGAASSLLRSEERRVGE